jgi:hypothetical protein
LSHHYATLGRQFLHFLKYLFAICSPQLEFWEYLFKWRPSSSPNTGLFCLLMHCIAIFLLLPIDYCRITIPGDVTFYISLSRYSPFVPHSSNFGNIFSNGVPALDQTQAFSAYLMHCDIRLLPIDYWRITIFGGAKFYISWSTYSPLVPHNSNFGNIFSNDVPALARTQSFSAYWCIA